jgi:hypothetical protein
MVELPVPNISANELNFAIPLGSASHQVRLRPVTLRADDFRVYVQIEDGSLMRVAPAPEASYRGEVAGVVGSVVAATWSDGRLNARIVLPDGEQFWVEPVAAQVSGAAAQDHLVYRNVDVLPSGGTCAAADVAAFASAGGISAGVGSTAGAGLYIAELGIDADFDFYSLSIFQSTPDPVAAVQTHIENIINAMNLQYERDVSIRHVISAIIIRVAEPDPYFKTCVGGSNDGDECSSTGQCPNGTCVADPRDILEQFRSDWQFRPQSIRGDVSQLFTGKSLAGSTIGAAYPSTVCAGSLQYSVVESGCFGCGSFACKTDLSAHEIGHSWSADHCGGDDCSPPCLQHTMNCELTCSNQFHPMETIPEILTFRDSRPCLVIGDDLRRVVILSDASTVSENGTLKFDALADFDFGEDVIVTSDAIWWVEPAEVGSIDTDGLFTPAQVNGNACATIRASYTYSGETVENFRQIVIVDNDVSFAIVFSDPPDGAIDARQPSDPDGARLSGWNQVDITFNGDVCMMNATDFTVGKIGGSAAAPTIAGVEKTGPRSLQLHLSNVLEPGTRTAIVTGDLSIVLGYLPGDSNADGVSAPPDILALIDALNGVRGEVPIWSSDIDRSGQAGPPDILRLIDLLNGAGAYDPWNGRALP